MKHIVLFQHSCAACSKVARMVRDLSITGLEARALGDPEVLQLLGTAGLQRPDRPSLLVVNGDDVQLISGWAMRKRLAGVVGWGRSGTIVRLLAAEWRARLARSAESHVLSRRGVIGGALAGVAGWALIPGSTAGAAPEPSESKTDLTLADPADVEKASAAASVQQAIRTWGPVEGDVYTVTRGGQPTLVLTHPRRGIFTFVDNSPAALRGGTPAALSMGKASTAAPAARFYTTGGTPLADVAVSGDHVTASAVSGNTIVLDSFNAEAEPDVSKAEIAIFIACIGENASATCWMNCITCVETIATIYGIVPCAYCLACAGPYGITCAIRAFF
jgi:hypothetical protein